MLLLKCTVPNSVSFYILIDDFVSYQLSVSLLKIEIFQNMCNVRNLNVVGGYSYRVVLIVRKKSVRDMYLEGIRDKVV